MWVTLWRDLIEFVILWWLAVISQISSRWMHYTVNKGNEWALPWKPCGSTSIFNSIFVHFWLNWFERPAQTTQRHITQSKMFLQLIAQKPVQEQRFSASTCLMWAADTAKPWPMFWQPVGAGGRAACFPSGESNTTDKITCIDWVIGNTLPHLTAHMGI